MAANKVKIPREVLEFFRGQATMIHAGDKKYYFFPVWLEDIGEGFVVTHPLGNLPKELKSAIESFRKNGFEPKLPD